MPNPTIADHIAGNPPAYTGWKELDKIKNKAIRFLNSLTLKLMQQYRVSNIY